MILSKIIPKSHKMSKTEYAIEKVGKRYSNNEIMKALKYKYIPLKFCYLEKGADNWDKLRGKGGQHHNVEFELGEREYAGLIQALSRVPVLKNPINIIHIGIGNGIELPAISSVFDFQKHSYLGVDISFEMIQNTIRYQKNILKKINQVSFILSDVEKKGNLLKICKKAKMNGNPVNLLLFTGEGTLLSNFKIFRYIADALDKNDLVLISLEGDRKSQRKKMLATYNLRASIDLFKVGLRKAGITKGVFLPAKFNEETHRVEVYFETPDKKKILCLTSYKPPSVNQFKETLEHHGLIPLVIEYYQNTQMYGAVCKKDRTDLSSCA